MSQQLQQRESAKVAGLYEVEGIYSAITLVRELGAAAVGRVVDTPPLGAWSGGVAVITAVHPDPNAPDIACNVRRVSDGEEIGVFHDECVKLLKAVES